MLNNFFLVLLIIFFSSCEVYTLAYFQAKPIRICENKEKIDPSEIDNIIEELNKNAKIQFVGSSIDQKQFKSFYFELENNRNLSQNPRIELYYNPIDLSIIYLNFSLWVQDFTEEEKRILQEILTFLEIRFRKINYKFEQTSIPFMSNSSKWTFHLEAEQTSDPKCF